MPDPTYPPAVETAIADAMERIGDRFHGHESVLRQMLAKPVSEVYQAGRNDLATAYAGARNAADVATELGITRQYLHQLAARMMVGMVIGGQRVYLPEDVAALRTRPDGRRRG